MDVLKHRRAALRRLEPFLEKMPRTTFLVEVPTMKLSAPPKRWNGRAFATGVAAGAGLGAGLMYLVEPKRRRLMRDRTRAVLRRGGRRMTREMRVAALKAQGRCRGMVHRYQYEAPKELDDIELAHKVETVLFRDPTVPKGLISVNAENGRVFLRGEVESAELIERLEADVRRIPEVRDVENLLHLPGTPAPAKSGGRLVHH